MIEHHKYLSEGHRFDSCLEHSDFSFNPGMPVTEKASSLQKSYHSRVFFSAVHTVNKTLSNDIRMMASNRKYGRRVE